MTGTKRFALRSPQSRKLNLSGWLSLSLVLSLASAAPVQAQHLPLPPDEQEAVNEAVRHGVDYLKDTQQKSGTWAKVGVSHRIGYAALPGLTLLECGVPASDPVIQQAARYLRARAGTLDTTYELSLGILFLDRLGDPKDKKIIQSFALRLIAGQSMTGGWGYKCPLLPAQNQKELLAILRHLDPWPNGMPGLARNPGPMPDIADGPGNKPGDLDPLARAPGRPALEGEVGQSGTPSLSASTSRGSLGESPSFSDGLAGGGPEAALAFSELIPTPPSRWRDCLGMGILDRRDADPLESDSPAQSKPTEAPAKPEDHGKAELAKPGKPFTIPSRLRMLTVVQDPALHILRDPLRKAHDIILTTTDNSNTQFAILALWTAQRHDVPMNRTLNLIVRRYLTSQNLDGTWNYRYRFGGAGPRPGLFSSIGAMTCVGLIGLAVGHGMAQPVRGGQPVRDPRIVRALTALYQMIGKPVERPVNLPMQNLYFLWSLERVAVLYNLPAIGDKDWYRWGAQVLLSNQTGRGNWIGGGYHGNSPALDTCLALLFLKRANLVKDLTSRLPFEAADLNHSIMAIQTPPPPQTAEKPSEPSPSIPKPIPSIEPPKKQETPDNLLTKPLSAPENRAPVGAASSDDATAGKSSGKTKWIVLSLIVFVLFAGGSVFVLLRARQGGEEEQGKPKKRKNKRKLQSSKSDG